MARPTIREPVNSSGGAPPRLNPNAWIQAPSRVPNGAQEVADQLMHILGVGGDLYTQKKNEQNAEDSAQGAADALGNSVDAAKLSKGQAYAKGARAVHTQAQVASDFDELTEGAKPFISSGDGIGLNNYMAEEFRKRWNGADKDALKTVVPEWSKLRAALQSELKDTAVANVSLGDASNLTKIAESEYKLSQLENRPFDYDKIFAGARATFGKNANEVTYQIVAGLIDDTNDPRLLDDMPDSLKDGTPSIKRVLKYADPLRAKRDKALTEQTKLGKSAEAAKHFSVLSSFEDDVEAERWHPKGWFLKTFGPLGYTGEQINAKYNQQLNAIAAAKKRNKEDLDLTQAFQLGLGQTYKSVVGNEKYADKFDAYINNAVTALPADKQVPFVIEASAKNGTVYRPLSNSLSNPNINDPQALSANVAKYRQLISSPQAGVASKYVTNEQTANLYHSIMTLEDLGYDPVQRLQAANQTLAKDRAARWHEGEMRKDVVKELDSIKLNAPDRWFNPKIKSVANSGFAQAEAYRIADALGGSGLFDSPEALLKTTKQLMEKRYVVLGDLFVPATADMPVNASEAVEHFNTNVIPKLLEGTGIKPSEVTLTPDGRTVGDRSTYGLYYKGTVVPVFDGEDATKRFTLNAIADNYAAFQNERLTKPERDRWARYDTTKSGYYQDSINKALTVEDYFRDRSKLTPQERERLDKGFVTAAREKQSAEATEAIKLLEGVKFLPNGRPQKFIDIDTVAHADTAKKRAEQWRDFADLLSN